MLTHRATSSQGPLRLTESHGAAGHSLTEGTSCVTSPALGRGRAQGALLAPPHTSSAFPLTLPYALYLTFFTSYFLGLWRFRSATPGLPPFPGLEGPLLPAKWSESEDDSWRLGLRNSQSGSHACTRLPSVTQRVHGSHRGTGGKGEHPRKSYAPSLKVTVHRVPC